MKLGSILHMVCSQLEHGVLLGIGQLPEEQSLCPMCNSQRHKQYNLKSMCILSVIYLYIDLRTDLFHRASSVNNDFNNFTDTQKLIFLMTNAEVIIQTAKTCHAILSKRHLFLYSNQYVFLLP